MESFGVYNPVRLKFGEGVTESLAADLQEYGITNILILIGKGSFSNEHTGNSDSPANDHYFIASVNIT
ncbi:MAG: hypothetical protein ACO31H_07530, partial [Bacteroidia bacterium]